MRPAVTTRAPVAGALVTTDETQRAIASWRATGLDEGDTADLARAATARVAHILGMPVTPHSATDRYGAWSGRLALSARRVEGDAFDAATLTNVRVGSTVDGENAELDAALWALDLTGDEPAVLVDPLPPAPRGGERNPVWVSYHYDPLAGAAASDTAALIGHCVVLVMREEFAVRTQGAGHAPSGAGARAAELLAPLRRLPV